MIVLSKQSTKENNCSNSSSSSFISAAINKRAGSDSGLCTEAGYCTAWQVTPLDASFTEIIIFPEMVVDI